ncbi:MAG TPA: glycosyltransferase [Candidatus Sulfotelmatobacter sp.]
MATITVPAAVEAATLSVLCVHNRYIQPGGEDQVFESESQLLAENGVRVEKVEEQTTYPSGLVRKIEAAVDCVWSRSWHQRFKSILRDRQPDLVHIHNFFSVISPSIYYACREEGVPVVQTLHNYRLLCPAATFYRDGHICEECMQQGPFHAVRYGCYRESKLATAALASMIEVHRAKKTWNEMVDCYIVLTEFARRKMIEGGLPAEKIQVKPNFVLPDPGAKTGPGDYALFVGRLVDLKGVGTLLKAWSKLPNSIPLVIAGDGPYREEMVKQIADLKLSNVEYRGRLPRHQTLAAMKGARFLVFPSEWYEGFPVTIAESFACGVPVLCSRLGGMQEIVEDGSTGWHFSPGDAEDLAEKAEWAWLHLEETSAMGFAARAEFEEKYGAERNFQMLSAIYESVLSRTRGARLSHGSLLSQ